MPEVFINYRTGDAEHAAATIQTHLSHCFGDESVFYAGKSIKPAHVYDTEIIESVRSSRVLIVVIGSAWLTADAQGRVRLHEEGDWVRREIREALELGLHVLPVLVGKHPERLTRSRLPPDIAALADRQWMRYDHRESARCLEAITKAITDLVPALVGRRTGAPPAGGTAGRASNSVSESSVHGSLFQVRDGGLRHNTNENSNNTTRLTANTGQSGGIGSIDGATFGTFINHSVGAVNTGSGNQYNAPAPVRNRDQTEPEPE